MLKKRLGDYLKTIIRGLPLLAAVGASLLPLHRFGQQFTILIVLVWIQVFFALELFKTDR